MHVKQLHYNRTYSITKSLKKVYTCTGTALRKGDVWRFMGSKHVATAQHERAVIISSSPCKVARLLTKKLSVHITSVSDKISH